MGASQWDQFRQIVLPGTLPAIFTGAAVWAGASRGRAWFRRGSSSVGGYRLLGRRSCLAEEVIIGHVVLVLERVDELLVDECEDVVVFQLDLVGLERPLGLAEHGQRAQVPRPQVLGASQRAVGDDAGFLERLLHVWEQRSDRAKAAD